MSARHRSRQRAAQILYQWDMRRLPVEDAIASFYDTLYEQDDEAERAPPPGTDHFMESLVRGTVSHIDELDRCIVRHSEHWRMERMSAVDRNILRMAAYELLHARTPAPVIIDEALELARQFSGDESVSFINGVLDALRRQVGGEGRS